MRSSYFLVLLVLFCFLISACGAIPPAPETLIDAAKGSGCQLKSVTTSDAFGWRFLGLNNSRNTSVECHAK